MGRELTLKEFAAASGVKYNTVFQHVKRKKLFVNDSGFIDIDSDINKIYIAEVTNGLGLYSQQVKAEEKKEPKQEKKQVEQVVNDEKSAEAELFLRRKQAEADKIEFEAELSRMKLEKQAGLVLPVALFETLFTTTIQGVLKNFSSEAHNMASIICGNDRTKLSLVTKKLNELLDSTTEKTKTDVLLQLSGLISEYQNVRGVGERV